MEVEADLAGLKVGDRYPVRLMGVINVSPESFYKGSVKQTCEQIAETAKRQAVEGAEVIDVGAKSTAPYLKTWIPVEEEVRRITSAIEAVKSAVQLPVSADTTKAKVAEAAIKAGATIINDVSGLKDDPNMAKTIAEHSVSAVLMAKELKPTAGTPIERVLNALKESLEIARKAGIPENGVVVDPGIGFFRYPEKPWYEWDCEVILNLQRLKPLGRPICVGVSRKSFIGFILHKEKPEDRLYGSLAATTIAVYEGAHLIRTHDVAETKDAIKLTEYIRSLKRRPTLRRSS
ncbi:MAG: dihydropteroate synthase [Candidatus Nezhaarchaeales archaeon]